MDSGLAGKPAPRNDDIPAFFRTLLDKILHPASVPLSGIWHLYAGWFDGNPAHLKLAHSLRPLRSAKSVFRTGNRIGDRARCSVDIADVTRFSPSEILP